MNAASRQSMPSARRIALHVLGRVLGRRQPLDDALKAAPDVGVLSPPDLAFARHLIATSLRRLGQIDAVIARCLDHPLPDKAFAARNALRLGVTQLLFLETPPHAAVSETVDLVREKPFRGLVNAVLRRVIREGAPLIAAQDPARLNTPDWLWSSWETAYGAETTRRIADAHLAEPPLDIVLKPGLDPESWREKLDATRLPLDVLRRYGGGRIESLPGFEDGAWWIQDAAATLPARLLDVRPDETVLDLCAAPGGKTAQFAAAGARVIAVDRSETRLKRVHDTLGRLRFEAETIIADASKWRPKTPVPKILLDAPCSATGTIRRHPDLPHIKGPKDVSSLTAAQDRLLANAVDMLAPGGVLIYCVCSLQPEEGEARIEALLGSGAAVTRRPIRREEIPGLPEAMGLPDAITPAGDLRTLPCHLAEHGGLDGFFVARLGKKT